MKNLSPNSRYLFFVFLVLISLNTKAQVGINTLSPDAGAILDIESSNKGMLVPRVDIPDLDAIAPITGGGTQSLLVYNIGSSTTEGFYYWDTTKTAWIPLTTEEDDDFYKVGTTDAAQNITDDIYRTGNMAIGKTTASSALDIQDNSSANAVSIGSTGSDNVVEIKRTGSKSGTSRGLYVNYANSDSGSNEQLAIGTYLRGGSGTGRRYGLYNNVGATVGNTRQVVGVYNKIRDGLGTKYGMWNNLTTTEDGTIYGVYTQTSEGTGFHEGIRNSLAGSENSENTGTGNYISNSGDGEHRGVSNALTGNGSGQKIGNYTNITQGTGNNYGTYNDINNTETGKFSYGTFNDINTDNGTNYAGWFDAYGTGSGVFYAAVFNRGHVVANESGGDNDFRIEGDTEENLVFVDASTDNVGIGTNTPSEKLEVNGTAEATAFQLSALNTKPASKNATGTIGEIRIADDSGTLYMYVCYDTNRWKRVELSRTGW